MDAVWLVGDMKTGEIARFELGYKAFAIWRPFNGFHWSANNPVDIHLRLEKFNPKLWLKTLMYRVVKIPGFWFHSIRYKPETRDVKYKELGERYYGNIDVNIVKEISFTPPICTWITDCKISDTDLVRHNGLWAYFGNPLKTLNITGFDTVNETVESVEPCGWVRMFGVPSKENFTLLTQKKGSNVSTSILWKYDTKQPRNDFYSNGVVDNDILYETTSAGVLYAMNPANGQIKWSTNPGKNLTKPILMNNLIVVGHAEGVIAYQKNGKVQWSFPSDAVTEPPVLMNTSLLFGDASEVLYAVHLETGLELWRMRMNWSNQTFPAAQSNDLFYITAGDSCYALDATTHDIVWSYETKGKITAAPVLADDRVYVYSWDTYVYALDANTGELVWSYETGFGSDISPVYRDGFLFVGSTDNNLYAFDAKAGELFWMFSCNAAIHSPPVMYGDYVFFGSDDGHVYAVDWLTGDPVWSFAPGPTIENNSLHNFITTPILSNLVLWNKTVCFGAKGILYGLNAQTIEPPPDEGSNDSSDDDEGPEDNDNNNEPPQDNETDTDEQNETDDSDTDQQEEGPVGFNPLLAVIGGGGIVLLLIVLYVLTRKRKQPA